MGEEDMQNNNGRLKETMMVTAVAATATATADAPLCLSAERRLCSQSRRDRQSATNARQHNVKVGPNNVCLTKKRSN